MAKIQRVDLYNLWMLRQDFEPYLWRWVANSGAHFASEVLKVLLTAASKHAATISPWTLSRLVLLSKNWLLNTKHQQPAALRGLRLDLPWTSNSRRREHQYSLSARIFDYAYLAWISQDIDTHRNYLFVELLLWHLFNVWMRLTSKQLLRCRD